jgi:phenylpropionate dioxygenase-like ring-hydroxylating dioxygenase large terminal subunit
MFAKELGRKPVDLMVCGDRIALFREGDRVFALHNRCPHRGIPLSVGRREAAGTISCAYHGWTYDLATGDLVAVLTDGPESPICGKVSVKSYAAAIRAGLVWVYVGEEPPPPVEADIPEELLRPDAVIMGTTELRKGNWRYAIENCIDEGHSKYLHRTALSQIFRQAPAWTLGVKMEPTEDGWLRRVRGTTVVQDEYPRVGKWPRDRFWKRKSKGQPTQLANKLPCLCRVGGDARGWTAYEYFVPVDETHHKAIMLSVVFRTGVGALAFRLKYWLNIYWLHYRFFNRSQDQWMVELMDTPPERLYRPDRSITGWRKWAHQTARGAAAPVNQRAMDDIEDALFEASASVS